MQLPFVSPVYWFQKWSIGRHATVIGNQTENVYNSDAIPQPTKLLSSQFRHRRVARNVVPENKSL